MRQTLDLVPRCNIADDLLRANDQKRYDALGRNIWARHDRLSLLGLPGVTEYQNLHPVGLGQDVAYEQTVGSAQRSGRYVHAPDGTPLAVSNNNGEYDLLHRDGQGDTVLALNPVGSVACGPEIDALGKGADECDNLLTPATPNRRWYNSARLDTTTETYQWGTRTYNPETATWQQPDTAAPSGAPDNVSIGTDPMVANRYAYVNGDPINHTDPTGHILEECATGELRSDHPACKQAPERRLRSSSGGSTADDFRGIAGGGACPDSGGVTISGEFRFLINCDALPDDFVPLDPDSAFAQFLLELYLIEESATSNDDFIRKVAESLAGFDAGRFGLVPVGRPEGPSRGDIPNEIFGSSGWNIDFIDDDGSAGPSPARHFVGFLAAGYFHPHTADDQLEVNEAPGRPGASLQDSTAGLVAIDLGIRLRRGRISTRELLFLVEVMAGDPQNTYNGNRPSLDVGSSPPLACHVPLVPC